MSWGDIRPYFRARIKTAAPDFTEWKQNLNTDNIPSTILNKSFHINVGSFGQVVQNQNTLESQGTATIKLFAKGQAKPQDAIDLLIVKGEAIVKECLKAINRATQPAIKNVKIASFNPVAYSPSDDNDIELTMIFSLTIFTDIKE